MSVGVLLITHPGIGTAMLHTANRILGGSQGQSTKCLEVPADVALEPLQANARGLLRTLDGGEGVLIITDVYGATPDNFARSLTASPDVKVIAGLNLAMLLRVFNYPSDDLPTLCQKAVDGAIRGVQACRPVETS